MVCTDFLLTSFKLHPKESLVHFYAIENSQIIGTIVVCSFNPHMCFSYVGLTTVYFGAILVCGGYFSDWHIHLQFGGTALLP